MEKEFKTALFLGGMADGRTRAIANVPERLGWDSIPYRHYGQIETEDDGHVEVYYLESGMTFKEVEKRIETLKKS